MQKVQFLITSPVDMGVVGLWPQSVSKYLGDRLATVLDWLGSQLRPKKSRLLPLLETASLKMPPKRRSLNITTLTGQRKAEAIQLKSSVLRLKRYMGLQVDATPAASQSSSTGGVTDHRTRELMNMEPRGSFTSSSSLTLEKLEREKEVVVKSYKQLCAINKDLIIAVEEAGEGELFGYNDIYSDEALETFLDQYTLMFSDTCALADAKLEELRGLEEVKSRSTVFSSQRRAEQRESPRVTPDADTVSRVKDWQRLNADRELNELKELQGRRQPPRPSATAQHGSPERLLQQCDSLSSLIEVNTSTGLVVQPTATVTNANALEGKHFMTFGPLLGPQNRPHGTLAPTVITTVAVTPINSNGSVQTAKQASPDLSSDEQEAMLLFQQMRRKYRGLTELLQGVDSSITILTSSSTRRRVDKLWNRIKEIQTGVQDYEKFGQRFVRLSWLSTMFVFIGAEN